LFSTFFISSHVPLDLTLLSFISINAPPPTEIYTLSLHDALPIFEGDGGSRRDRGTPSVRDPQEKGHPALPGIVVPRVGRDDLSRSEEHTSELQSLRHLVCRLLLEKKKKKIINRDQTNIILLTHCS